jgi:hypothetical protein
MNETRCDIKAQHLEGETGGCRGVHLKEELKTFRKTMKRLEAESDALKNFLKMT